MKSINFNWNGSRLQKIIFFLLGYRWMDVYLAGTTRDYYEDPRCPSAWRGSGIYDIPCYLVSGVHVEVFARDVEKAKRLALEEVRSNHSDYGRLTVVGVCPRPYCLSDDICSDYINDCCELDSRDEICGFTQQSMAEKFINLKNIKLAFV